MSIVTKTGDDGTTALMYGRRVGKGDSRVEANGAVDELNAAIGMARAAVRDSGIAELLRGIQTDLVGLMGEVATHPEDWERYGKDGFAEVTSRQVAKLEAAVRDLESRGIATKGWALPGGTQSGAALDMARAICRRAERRMCGLREASRLRNLEILVYLNRLSDLLWLLARRVENEQESGSEEGDERREARGEGSAGEA